MNAENIDETFLCGCGSLLHVFNLSYISGKNVLYLNISINQNRNFFKRIGTACRILLNQHIPSGIYEPILVNNKDLKRMYNICEKISEDTELVVESSIENERYRLQFSIDREDFYRIYIEVHQKPFMSLLQKICFVSYYVLRFRAKYGVEKFQIDAEKASHLKGLLGYTHLLAKDLQ